MGNWAKVGLLTGLLAGSAVAKDEIVFSTAPTQTPEQTTKLYTPLMDHLSRTTGKRFVIKPAKTFIEYNNNTLQNGYDMVFDGPHYTGWRMERRGAVPLARLPGAIKVVVVVRAESTVQRMDDLIARRVCAFASPNMLTMVLLNYFDNPVRQPTLLSMDGFKEVAECVKSGRGEAAVLREEAWAKQDQTGLRVIPHNFRSYPERTFSVTSEIDPETRAKITAALISDEGAKAAAGLLESFKKPGFIAAVPAEYKGLDELLFPVWGFQ